jgi:general nucleoside transport system permease protein
MKEVKMPFEVVLRSIFSAAFLASVLRISTPLILPALGGLITDLSGAINIALEGIMLTSAFTGVIVSAYSGSVFIGVLAGILSGIAISYILGWFHLHLETDIILAGIAINILASGGTIFLLFVLTGQKGNSQSLASGVVPNIHIPLIQDIPFLGRAFSGQHIFVWFAFLLTWLVAIYLYRTPWGTHLRAVGENPDAAETMGINVKRTQMIALLISGFLASFGGLTMSMAYLSFFQRDMTAGRGFIALAAVYLGGRKPWGTLLAAILFGFADAISHQLGSLRIPSQLVQMIPYFVTILALVVYALREKAIKRDRQRQFFEQQTASIASDGEA